MVRGLIDSPKCINMEKVRRDLSRAKFRAIEHLPCKSSKNWTTWWVKVSTNSKMISSRWTMKAICWQALKAWGIWILDRGVKLGICLLRFLTRSLIMRSLDIMVSRYTIVANSLKNLSLILPVLKPSLTNKSVRRLSSDYLYKGIKKSQRRINLIVWQRKPPQLMIPNGQIWWTFSRTIQQHWWTLFQHHRALMTVVNTTP